MISLPIELQYSHKTVCMVRKVLRCSIKGSISSLLGLVILFNKKILVYANFPCLVYVCALIMIIKMNLFNRMQTMANGKLAKIRINHNKQLPYYRWLRQPLANMMLNSIDTFSLNFKIRL